jgi:penicillin-binding protein 1A
LEIESKLKMKAVLPGPEETPEQSGKTSWSMRFLRLSLLFSALMLLAGTISIYLWLKALGVFNLDKSRISILENYSFRDNSIVYDSDQKKIGEFFDRYHVFVPFEELPDHFVKALTGIEDASFFDHHGVDYRAILRVIVSRLKSESFNQGGSTITQQLVRNTILHNERSIERKIQEIAWALEVERHLSKEKILELYVNIMFLGNGSYGVGAAAHRYFGKEMRDISAAESALIAGLFQSPSRYNPAKYPERAKKRQLMVIEAMRKHGTITESESKTIAAQKLVYQPYKFINTEKASWFVDYVADLMKKLKLTTPQLKKSTGLRIYTTLNSRLQSLAERSVGWYDKPLNELSKRTGKIKDPESGLLKNATVEASMLVTDPKNGDILAMVGGRNYRKSQFNRTTSALRSPGSAFKPVVYTEALFRGFKWSDMIYVSPINIENYRPKNQSDDYLTETTMMRAFYRSMNSPTIEIATKIGLPAIIDRAKKLGIKSPIKQEFGSALGSSDVTMLDLARLYGTYANQGMLTEPSAITKITNADGDILWERSSEDHRTQRVINAQIAYLMTQGMRAVLTSGTAAKSSDLAVHAAGKTGTSNDSSDNWFCGYTSNLVSIVWVGTDEHAPIYANASGSSVALPIWDQFVRNSFTIRPPTQFERPDGITEATIHPRYGHRIEGGARMYFLESNQPIETSSALESIEQNSDRTYRNVFRH